MGTDVLLVEGDPDTIAIVRQALEPLGRALVVATTGPEAVAKLLEQDFALILLDASGAGLTSVETARLARRQARDKHLPIVFITAGAASQERVVEAYQAGANDVVAKPVIAEVLRAKVQVYLQLQERTRALVEYARTLHRAQQVTAVDRSAERRLAKLQQVTVELARAITPDEVASVAVRLGREAVDAKAAGLWAATDHGSLALAAQSGYPDGYLDPWLDVSLSTPTAITRAFATREPIWVQHLEDYARAAPETHPYASKHRIGPAFAAIPLRVAGLDLGVLVVVYDRDHLFPPEEREFVSTLGHACEQAFARARLYVAEKEARELAEEASRRKDELLAMLGHELRNPLAAMVSAFELLASRGVALGRELRIVERQVSHLHRLVNDLVDVGRVTHGTIVLARRAIEVSRAVADALVLSQPLLDEHGHEIVVTVPPDLVVDADPERIAQVLANVLTNAIKYTPGTGRIEIEATRDADRARIVIRDHGIGIPAALLPAVFDPFVQGERPLDRASGGLGVGLTLVRALIELHSGTVTAESAGPGTGAAFILTWPLATSTMRVAEVAPAPRAAATRSFKVLVVDDNRDAAELLAAILEELGHEVRVAHDAAAACEHAARFAPDVAILDIGLPNRDGYALVGDLRQLPACAATVMVALTGYGQPEDRERALAAGFAHHHVKPIELKALTSLFASVARSPSR